MVSRCGVGRTFDGRLLVKIDEGYASTPVDIVIWGASLLRPDIDFGIPYILNEGRFKKGKAVYKLTSIFPNDTYYVGGEYPDSVHFGSDSVLLPAIAQKFDGLFKTDDPISNNQTEGGCIKIENGIIWPNSNGVPYNESTKLVNSLVTSPTGQVINLFVDHLYINSYNIDDLAFS